MTTAVRVTRSALGRAGPASPGRSPVRRGGASARLSPARMPLATRNPGPTLQLARSAGNAAFTNVVQRQATVSRAPSAADRTRAQNLETRLRGISTAAGARATAVLAHSDRAVAHLHEASAHLSAAGTSYREGHDAFLAVLRRADAEYEFDNAVADGVQGVLVAAALAVVLPEALLTMGAMAAARQLVASTSTRLTSAGIAIASAGPRSPWPRAPSGTRRSAREPRCSPAPA